MTSVVKAGQGRKEQESLGGVVRRNQNVEINDAAVNYIDGAPKAMMPKTRQDDYWAQMSELQKAQAFGPDKLLGAREYSSDYVKYAQKKKDENLKGELYGLLEESYDPLDPVQGRMIAEIAPELKKSRLSFIDR